MTDVQTRSEETGLRTFSTLKDAFEHASKDVSVWKVSFDMPNGERIRLVRVGGNTIQESGKSYPTWCYDPIIDEFLVSQENKETV